MDGEGSRDASATRVTRPHAPSIATAQRVLAAIVVEQRASLDDLAPVAAAFAVEMRRRWPEISDHAMTELFSQAVHASLK